MISCYDRYGSPITREQFGILFEDSDYKVVAKRKFEGGVEVSTVWLGLDHRFGAGPPLIFETMIFAPDPYPYADAQMRYSTLEEAQRGHDRACADVEAGRRPWFLTAELE
jgi:hypothetical protein